MLSSYSKTDTADIIGPQGCKAILEHLGSFEQGRTIPTVAIGGLNELNIEDVISQSRTDKKSLDGVAVVSAVMSATDPAAAAQKLRQLVDLKKHIPKPVVRRSSLHDRSEVLGQIQDILKRLVKTGPLCHNMTKYDPYSCLRTTC